MVKPSTFIATSAMLLLLGLSGPAYSRQGKEDKSKGQEKQNGQGGSSKPSAPQGNGQSDHQRQQPAQGQEHPQAQQHPQNQQRPQTQQPAQTQQRQQSQPRTQTQQPAQAQQRPQGQQRSQPGSPVKGPEQAKGQQVQQRQPQRQQQNAKVAPQRNPAQIRQEQVAWQGNRAKNWKSDHRTWQQRGGYSGYRVPNDRFTAYYGQSHGFRIYNLPVEYVGGSRRFQYGGFWFGLVDPWPEYWASNWYDDDDVYVDYYGDGYYLYDRRYPGDRIAISFYLN